MVVQVPIGITAQIFYHGMHINHVLSFVYIWNLTNYINFFYKYIALSALVEKNLKSRRKKNYVRNANVALLISVTSHWPLDQLVSFFAAGSRYVISSNRLFVCLFVFFFFFFCISMYFSLSKKLNDARKWWDIQNWSKISFI